jgi:hypothetical protein
MRRGMMLGAAIGAGLYYWASKQPGGCQATWDRFMQGMRDVGAGQDPIAVGKRFFAGSTEEPAGVYTAETAPDTNVAHGQQPYRDMVTSP